MPNGDTRGAVGPAAAAERHAAPTARHRIIAAGEAGAAGRPGAGADGRIVGLAGEGCARGIGAGDGVRADRDIARIVADRTVLMAAAIVAAADRDGIAAHGAGIGAAGETEASAGDGALTQSERGATGGLGTISERGVVGVVARTGSGDAVAADRDIGQAVSHRAVFLHRRPASADTAAAIATQGYRTLTKSRRAGAGSQSVVACRLRKRTDRGACDAVGVRQIAKCRTVGAACLGAGTDGGRAIAACKTVPAECRTGRAAGNTESTEGGVVLVIRRQTGDGGRLRANADGGAMDARGHCAGPGCKRVQSAGGRCSAKCDGVLCRRTGVDTEREGIAAEGQRIVSERGVVSVAAGAGDAVGAECDIACSGGDGAPAVGAVVAATDGDRVQAGRGCIGAVGRGVDAGGKTVGAARDALSAGRMGVIADRCVRQFRAAGNTGDGGAADGRVPGVIANRSVADRNSLTCCGQ